MRYKWIQIAFYRSIQIRYVTALLISGKKKEAEAYLNSGEIKKKRTYALAKAYFDLGRVYIQGDAEKYTEIYAAAPKSYKKVKNHAFRALIIEGKYDEVIETLTRYTPKNKREDIICRFLLGEAYLKRGLKDEARPHLEYVINNGKTLRERYMAEELYKEL